MCLIIVRQIIPWETETEEEMINILSHGNPKRDDIGREEGGM